MARLTPVFSTNRVVRQYTDDHYVSAATAFAERATNQGALGAQLLSWRTQLAKHWPALRFGATAVEQKDGRFLFQTQVYLDELDPKGIGVELYAEGQNGTPAVQHAMNRGEPLAGSANGFLYTASIPASRAAADFTPRIVPRHGEASVPIEAPFILWHDSPSWR
jgi:starch phosphorylase